MKTIEAVQLWHRACELAIQTHDTLAPCDNPAMREEITRDSVDVATNIAQGYEINSRQSCCQFLASARGRCAALRTRLYIAGELSVIDSESSCRLINETLELSSQLDHLIEQFETKYCAWN